MRRLRQQRTPGRGTESALLGKLLGLFRMSINQEKVAGSATGGCVYQVEAIGSPGGFHIVAATGDLRAFA